MPKREWTEEERKAFGEKMKAAREAKKNEPEIKEIDYLEVLKNERY